MDASVMGIRLASGVVTPLVKKLLRGEGAGADLVDRPVRISSYVSPREQRTLSRDDLRALADKLVDRALRAPGERPLPPGEEAGVAAALAATLHALGDLAMEDVQAVEMGPAAFAAALRRAAPATGLGRDAELFHDRLLELTCLHVLHFFTTRSTYIPRALVEQARRQAELIAKMDELLSRTTREDARDPGFETRYLAYLAQRHSSLTIFGIELPPGSARWPLDTAYVSLEVASLPRQRGGAEGPDAGAPRARTPGTAEEALTREPRVLLRGEAGSGKTTLIQRLTVSTAREAAEGGPVPYVLPLRSLTRYGERLPAPEDFLVATALKGQAPEGWESRVLSAGRGLILVDGIDEIPEAERARARDWLCDLLTAYPADALPAVPAAQALGDAPAVLRRFVERTGLLRAPTQDTVEFVHRTFQDYLGARAALDEGSLGVVTRHAEDDQWEDVIRMAVAQGRPLERAAIIGDLLVRGSDRAVLLAFAAVEYAAELEPELRDRVRAAARRLVPPKDEDAARALGRIGPLVLDLLPRGEEARRSEAHLSVIAAMETGSETAVGFLAGYCRDPDERVRETLTRGWQRFGTPHYAAEVLARMDPPPRDLVIGSDDGLDALRGFTGPPDLFIRHEVTRGALARFLARQPVSGLTLWSFQGGSDAEFLRGHTSLRRLNINAWSGLRDLAPLHGLPLEDVSLYVNSTVPLGPALAAWPRLRAFQLHAGHGPWSFEDFSPEARPEVLEVDDADPDLAGLGRLTSLRRLWLGHPWRPGGKAAWAQVSALGDLLEIAVHAETLDGLAAYADLPSLRSVMVYDDDKEWDAGLEERVLRRFPQARLESVPQMYDI